MHGRAELGMKVLRRSWSLKMKGTFQEEGGVRPRGAVLSFCTQVGGSLVWRPSMQVLHRDCPCSNPSLLAACFVTLGVTLRASVSSVEWGCYRGR